MTIILAILGVLVAIAVLNVIMPFIIGLLMLAVVVGLPLLGVAFVASQNAFAAVLVFGSFIAVAALLDWKRTKGLFNA
jgi:hypothetical protein